jgi:hypothetical protein
MSSARERFQVYADFWLGVASAGAQGLADAKDAWENDKRKHSADGAIASGITALMEAGASAMKRVANEADIVRERVDHGEKKREEKHAEEELRHKETMQELAALRQVVHDLRQAAGAPKAPSDSGGGAGAASSSEGDVVALPQSGKNAAQ